MFVKALLEMEPVSQRRYKILKNRLEVTYLIDYREECSSKNGVSDGSCASGFGVCCIGMYLTVFYTLHRLRYFVLLAFVK